MTTMRQTLIVSLGMIVLAVACAGSAAQQTAPTAVAASAGSGSPPAGGPQASGSSGATSDTTGAGTATTTPAPQTPPPGFAIAMGAVSGVSGECPALTLTIDGKKVAVDAKTVYEGGTCATLKAATKAAAGGPVQADGRILAQRVKLGDAMPANPPSPPSPPPANQATVQGTAANVAGTCPALTLTIDGRKVKITAATKFERGVCADMKDGARAGAIGRLVGDTIEADRAIVAPAGTPPPPTGPNPTPNPPPGPPRVQGVVSALAGTCPSVTLTIGTQKVAMTATTKWEKGTCADLKNGNMAGAIGPIANGILTAERAITAPR